MSAGLLAIVASAPASAQFLVGMAEVVDGDSLRIDGQDVDLFGVDAPELAQACTGDAGDWPCGDVARERLEQSIAGRTVRCEPRDGGTGAAALAVCTAGTLDLSGAMAEAGLAVALTDLAPDYAGDADRAATQRRGIWGGRFQMPGEWRAAQPPLRVVAEQASAAPRVVRRQAQADEGGCLIKGNRNRRGEWIYHLPGMPYYEPTRAEEWFCSEAEAQAAGYRRAIVRR